MKLKKLLLYINTVKHLRAKQFLYNFIRRFFTKKNIVIAGNVNGNSLKFLPPIKYVNKIDSISVCFLNVRRKFDYIVNWECMEEPKLWRYNLHYFDFLLDDGASIEIKDKLIDDWVKISHSLKEDAWEPYPISLRLVNWVKYFTIYKKNEIPDAWLRSLYQQAGMLCSSIEYHILANHYLKNGKGLLFAAAYLNCDESKGWYEQGKRIMLEEASEQILDDGGHYEKSPMYHSILVEDYLDVINLIQSNSLDFERRELSFLKTKVKSALTFLDSIIMPDGEIPFFNDSAFNVAPLPEKIFAYAKKIVSYERIHQALNSSIASLVDSGYFVIRDDQSMCVIDCGSISPGYQPGHTHCDLLSYELAIDGSRCVVNSGSYDYENSEERRYCRSTRAHNTVEIDGREQSEVWGQFRVARRAKVHSVLLEHELDSGQVFSASYSPYWGVKQGIVHSRHICHKGKAWVVNDEITGSGEHTIRNYIHIHPDFNCVKENDEYCLIKNGAVQAKISFPNSTNITLEDGWYYPEFGIRRKNTILLLSASGVLPINQSYVIESL